jgi:hypothetical protein
MLPTSPSGALSWRRSRTRTYDPLIKSQRTTYQLELADGEQEPLC